MEIYLTINDITKVKCDAIVNAANTTLLGGSGVDGAIHKAAGKGLFWECLRLGGCKVGKAKITQSYGLPCKYIIHTVGPKWRGGKKNEEELLKSCYIESLKLAQENGCTSVAFPLISCGVYGYPVTQAFDIAMQTVVEFGKDSDMQIIFVTYKEEDYHMCLPIHMKY